MKTNEIFKENYNKLRRKNKLSHLELADEIGINENISKKYASGKKLPPYSTMVKIGKVFNTSVNKLLRENMNLETQIINFHEFNNKLLIDNIDVIKKTSVIDLKNQTISFDYLQFRTLLLSEINSESPYMQYMEGLTLKENIAHEKSIDSLRCNSDYRLFNFIEQNVFSVDDYIDVANLLNSKFVMSSIHSNIKIELEKEFLMNLLISNYLQKKVDEDNVIKLNINLHLSVLYPIEFVEFFIKKKRFSKDLKDIALYLNSRKKELNEKLETEEQLFNSINDWLKMIEVCKEKQCLSYLVWIYYENDYKIPDEVLHYLYQQGKYTVKSFEKYNKEFTIKNIKLFCETLLNEQSLEYIFEINVKDVDDSYKIGDEHVLETFKNITDDFIVNLFIINNYIDDSILEQLKNYFRETFDIKVNLDVDHLLSTKKSTYNTLLHQYKDKIYLLTILLEKKEYRNTTDELKKLLVNLISNYNID